MSAIAPAAIPAPDVRRRRRRPPARAWAGLGIVGVFVLAAVFGPMLLPYDPVATDLPHRLLPPGSRLGDGSVAWLGTDQVGRDMLTTLLAGSRVSLLVGTATVLIGGAAAWWRGSCPGTSAAGPTPCCPASGTCSWRSRRSCSPS